MRRLAIALCLIAAPGCSRGRASAEDCREIFDRIVELELRERGFRDPALTARKRRELGRRLAGELDACVGRPLDPGALPCLRSATTNEEITHRCLR